MADQPAAVTREDALAFADEAFRNRNITFSHRDVVDMTGALGTFLSRRLASVSSASATDVVTKRAFRMAYAPLRSAQHALDLVSRMGKGEGCADACRKLADEESRRIDNAIASMAHTDGERETVPEPVPATNQAGEVAVEALAQFLHDEGGFGDAMTDRTWPDHADDTGQREGGWVKIVPADVQAHFRDVARRWLGSRLATQPATSQEGERPLGPHSVMVEGEDENSFMPVYALAGNLVYLKQGDAQVTMTRAMWRDLIASLAATPTPPTLSVDLREAEVEQFIDAGFATVSRNPSDHETAVAYREAVRLALAHSSARS